MNGKKMNVVIGPTGSGKTNYLVKMTGDALLRNEPLR